jgi:hypothetical protein
VLDISQRRAGNTKSRRGNRCEIAGEMSRSAAFASCMKGFRNSLLCFIAPRRAGSPVAFAFSLLSSRLSKEVSKILGISSIMSLGDFSARSISQAIAFEQHRFSFYSIF